jgi:hypothetical protein
MLQLVEPKVTPDAIQATLNYIFATGELLCTHTVTTGGKSKEVRTGSEDPRSVTIKNGRLAVNDLSLEGHGFRLVTHNTKMVNFFDESELRRVYYPEMEALIKEETGASRVILFDHTLRTADNDLAGMGNTSSVICRVHNDNTECSGPARVREVLPQEADEIISRRFAIVQVWRPIKYPIETFPLGLMDARTASPDDFVVLDRHFQNGSVRKMYLLKHNPKHEWFWFPRMQRNETIVFKTYDSLQNGNARWTPHSAFDDPTSPPHARPRESIEIRAFALL